MKKTIYFLILIVAGQCVYAQETVRQKIDLNGNWKFRSKIMTDTPAAADYDDTSWTTVNIPHTWNATDAQDGGNNYLRTVGWYRKNVPWNTAFQNKKLFIELLAASLQSECFINGESVGFHKGGYTAFRFDITSKMKPGNNIIAIKVDNRFSTEIMPLGGDFSMLGGIYRNISLIVADQVHVDLADNASSGLYLTTTDVSEAKADLEIKANIVNESSSSKTVTIEGVIKNPDSFEAVSSVPSPVFDVQTMYPGGSAVRSVSKTVTIPSGGSYRLKEKVTIDNPRLWNGKKDPYRYVVDLKVKDGEKVLDVVSEHVGFRYFSVTKDGFFLNGNLYPLRGVCKHQDRYNKGYAVSRADQDEDFGMMYDIGANAVRFAHYPHDPYAYDLCDRYGLVVWAEIPLVDTPGSAATFNEVTKTQLTELIRQQYNRPSIFFWGLQNEIRTQYDTQMKVLMKELNDLAHAEDPGRPTVQASNHTTARNWDSDLFAWNYYPGWYVENPRFSGKLDDFKISETRPTALSEYGAGGCIDHHEINPNKPVTNGGKFHPEEYQNKVHETAISDFVGRDFVWGTFLWNMFDFASDGRNEGNQPGMNDKGLVTYDRKIKKDAYFAYKANWSDDPMVYISSRRYTERREKITPVTIYSNCESVELFVNDISKGIKRNDDVQCGFFKWDNVELSSGENRVKAVAVNDSKTYSDEITWTKVSGTTTDLYSDELVIDISKKSIVLKNDIPAQNINNYLKGLDGATFVLVEADGQTPVVQGNIKIGMKVIVTSEDDRNKAVYEFISGHIALTKNTVSDSEETGNSARNATDGDFTTRWAAADRNAHWVEVDLGNEYVLNQITIQWYNPNGTRTYQYNVKTAGEDRKYETEIDRSANTQSDGVTDKLTRKSRYVKVEVTGANATTAYASLYEIEVYGWRLESEEYKIDHADQTISIPGTEENKTNLVTEKFLENITFEGNLSYSLNSMSYFIQENDELTITDFSGNKTTFKLVFSDVSSVPRVKDLSDFFRITGLDNRLSIELKNTMISADLEIFDLPGRMIASERIAGTYNKQLEKGIYLIKMHAVEFGDQLVKCVIK